MKKPDGFMLYFDRLDPMRELTNEEKGAVFSAVWEYAEAGALPELSPALMPYWRLLRRNIDDGTVRYNETSVKNRYNRYKGEMKRRNLEPAEMWEWWAEQADYTTELFQREDWHCDAENRANDRQRPSTTVNECDSSPTSVTNTNPTQHEPNTNTNTGTCTLTNTGGIGGDDTDSAIEAFENTWRAYTDMLDETGHPLKDPGATLEHLTKIGESDPRKMAEILRRAITNRRPELVPINGVGVVIGTIAAACSSDVM